MKIGLGTAAIGRPEYINMRQTPNQHRTLEAFRAHGLLILEEAYRQGIRYFDAAPGYGMAEQLLMDWASQNQYPDLEFGTKWGYTYLANFEPNATLHELKEHSLKKLKEQWKESKKLLPHLSTYQIHSATLESGVLENTEVLDYLFELKTAHGLRVGLTTSGPNQLETLKKALNISRGGTSLFDVFQVTYNLLEQSLAEMCVHISRENKRVIVKEALANGKILGVQNRSLASSQGNELSRIAQKYQVGVDAVALRFCLDTIDPFLVLSGAAEQPHLGQNLQASSFQLTESECQALKEYAQEPAQYWHERSLLKWN